MRLLRLVAVALVLAPLPVVAATASGGALASATVEARDGDLWLGGRRLTSTPAEDREPEWSPDGWYVAFVRQEAGERGSSLYVVRRDGRALRRLTGASQAVAMPAWSPDGLAIAFAASPLIGGSFDIWTVGARGGGARRVSGGPAEQVSPRWTAAGELEHRVLQPGESFPVRTQDTADPPTGPRELLPDFDQRPPFRLTLDGTKLGFGSATDNVGDGPIWVRGVRASSGVPMGAQQLVRRTDGSVRVYEGAGRLRYTAASTHSHWHLLDFQRYELRTPDGRLIVRDRKSGFCLADHYGLARLRVAAFAGPRFVGRCAAGRPRALAVEQGTSPGYTDRYPPHLHGQNLELRGVPAGVYLLVHRANASGALVELDYANNAASLRIRLTWRDGSPRVEMLRTCHDSAAC